jgi:hypothetical protein
MTAAVQTVQEAHFGMRHARFMVMRGTVLGFDQTARCLLSD